MALEGNRIVEGYEPLAVGFAVAEQRKFETTVEDGFLDIEFFRQVRTPKISAIEIVSLD